jgi:hypothetical protein
MRARNALRFAPRAARCAASNRDGSRASGGGIPDVVVDAVENSAQRIRAIAQQSVEAHAASRRSDLGGVRRRHGGDAIREAQARLEITDRTVVLDTFDRPRVPRQADVVERETVEAPLEREVVHGHDRAWTRAAVVVQVRGRETRLPIVCVHDIRNERAGPALPDVRRRARERREAQRIVGEAPPVGTRIGVSRPCVQVRRIEDEKIEPACAGGAQPRPASEQRRVFVNDTGVADRRHHRGVAWQHRAHHDLLARERYRKRADDVGETARLDQRKRLGRDRQDVQGAQGRRVRSRPAGRASTA